MKPLCELVWQPLPVQRDVPLGPKTFVYSSVHVTAHVAPLELDELDELDELEALDALDAELLDDELLDEGPWQRIGGLSPGAVPPGAATQS